MTEKWNRHKCALKRHGVESISLMLVSVSTEICDCTIDSLITQVVIRYQHILDKLIGRIQDVYVPSSRGRAEWMKPVMIEGGRSL